MAETTTTERAPGLLESIPHGPRRTIEGLLLAGAIAGALMSVVGLVSFLARLLFISNAWQWVEEVVQSSPQFVILIVTFLGDAFHLTVEAYRQTIYPIVHWALGFISIRLDPWQIDTLFVIVFSVVAGMKVAFMDRRLVAPQDRRVAWALKIANLPIEGIFLLGLWVVNTIDNGIYMLTKLVGSPFKAFLGLFKALPPPLNWLVIGTICNALILSTLLGVDYLYALLRANGVL